MSGPMPRVRRAEVRRRVLDAAAEVFARRGYEAARLEEIATVAGFSKGAVYSNFDGKPALLTALIQQRARTVLAGSGAEIAELIAGQTVAEGPWHRLIVEIAQRAVHDPAARSAYVDVRRGLRAELAAGLAGQGLEFVVPVEQVALTVGALRMGLALEHGADPEQIDEAVVAAVFAQTLRGVIRRAPEPEELA